MVKTHKRTVEYYKLLLHFVEKGGIMEALFQTARIRRSGTYTRTEDDL